MIREVLFMGRDSVRFLGKKDRARMAMISILSEEDIMGGKGRPRLSGFSTIASIEFEDVHEGMFSGSVPAGCEDWGDHLEHMQIGAGYSPYSYEVARQAPTIEHARKIVEFVERVIEDPAVDVLAVHCKAGQSRSAAVAMFVSETYGIPIGSMMSTEKANPRLLKLLAKAHREIALAARPSQASMARLG